MIPDRIVAATYSVVRRGGWRHVRTHERSPSHMEAVLSVAEQYGAKLYISEDRIVQVAPKSGSRRSR